MKKLLLIIVGIAIVIIAVIKLKNKDLHSAKVKGTIERCSYSFGKQNHSRHYVTIKINKTEYKVTITPVAGNEFQFADVARVGDTVFKSANNDTLTLTRTGYDDTHFPYIVKQYKEN